MGPIFYLVLNMGIMASAIGLVVLLLRLALRHRLPAAVRHALWALVLLRLLLPFSWPSEASILNPIGRHVTRIASYPVGGLDMTVTNALGLVENQAALTAVNFVGVAGRFFPQKVQFRTEALAAAFQAMGLAWLIGTLAFALSAAALYALTARRFGSALPVGDGGLLAECAAIAGVRREVQLCGSDAVSSPVVFGVFRPRIVIPPALAHDREALRFVLLHELAHIRRGDNALRVVSAALLCVHWFNPLVWLMFLLSGQDMELACDAAVLRRIDQPARKQYALALAALAGNRQPVLAAAFGQSVVRQRILGIVQYKRATVATIILSAAFLAALAVVLLTNPAVG